MSFKTEVKGRGCDRWCERRWWLWCGDMRRMRWTRRTVIRMRLTEWRRELTHRFVQTVYTWQSFAYKQSLVDLSHISLPPRKGVAS